MTEWKVGKDNAVAVPEGVVTVKVFPVIRFLRGVGDGTHLTKEKLDEGHSRVYHVDGEGGILPLADFVLPARVRVVGVKVFGCTGVKRPMVYERKTSRMRRDLKVEDATASHFIKETNVWEPLAEFVWPEGVKKAAADVEERKEATRG